VKTTWLPSGEIAYVSDYVLDLILPAGYFRFEEVPLLAGENTFYATASFASGNVSPPSQEIILILDPGIFPDLAISPDDIFIYPAMPVSGEETMISVLVRNHGSSAVEYVPVEINIRDAAGNVEPLLSQVIPVIGPYGTEVLSLAWDSTGKGGANRVMTLLDAGDVIPESDEGNNNAEKTFHVAEEEGLSLATDLDSDQYSSNRDVAVRIDLRNSGIGRDLRLEVRIEDEGGAAAAVLDARDIHLPYASVQAYEYVWNTGWTYAGAYRVQTLLTDGTGIVAQSPVS